MQSIAIADNQLESVEAGTKTIVIRLGYCSIQLGPLHVRSVSGFWPTANVNVLAIDRKPISSLTTEELRQNGYADPKNMVEMLKSMHPCVSTDTEATVIRWERQA
ncbi:hypothetical protein [Rhizobium sp. BK176]|uniref:hypothetical protein n=1 Tax=Rhizobium sp. BK176 TaxID=2587071 RepID=UPI002168D2D5|nr:hypothetical protein [Rhizobium sp. BK176]MCS4088539.1 hypothetical protein [Rhizobium sp. BK176]